MYEDIFESIRKEAAKRNLRESTANAYYNSVGYFLRTVNKVPMELTTLDVDAFLTEKRLQKPEDALSPTPSSILSLTIYPPLSQSSLSKSLCFTSVSISSHKQ